MNTNLSPEHEKPFSARDGIQTLFRLRKKLNENFTGLTLSGVVAGGPLMPLSLVTLNPERYMQIRESLGSSFENLAWSLMAVSAAGTASGLIHMIRMRSVIRQMDAVQRQLRNFEIPDQPETQE